MTLYGMWRFLELVAQSAPPSAALRVGRARARAGRLGLRPPAQACCRSIGKTTDHRIEPGAGERWPRRPYPWKETCTWTPVSRCASLGQTAENAPDNALTTSR